MITSLRVQNVRIHHDYELTLLPHTTVVTGPNGSGKTSLIEAIYIALRGSSFKGVDNDILRRETSWYRIDVAEGESVRTIKFDPTRTSGKKQFVIDGKTHYRLLPKHKRPVVLFEPNDLRLLHGSPSRRRDYMDTFIAQLDPLYSVALRRYERALKQRNNLLKQHSVSSDELFVWDMALSEHGAYIVKKRSEIVQQMNSQLAPIYRTIAGKDDAVTVHYPHEMSQQKLLADLHTYAQRDTILGFTSVGPHRHDIMFQFADSPALAVASRGEVRSIMLALKFIEVEIMQQLLDMKPIILLDDVFSELDATRQDHLVQNFKDYQIVITSATGSHSIKQKFVHQL
jgi:DNA replication and repair protein RecF